MTQFLAERLKKIKPSATVAVTSAAAELKAKGIDVIGLGAGEPDFATDKVIIDAAKKALDAGKTKYTPAAGIPQLREAICKKFKRENNLDYNLSEITIGCGGKQIIYHAFLATLNQADEVIIPAPYWVSYVDQVLLCEGTPIIVECPMDSGFKLTDAQLKQAITPKTKWLILNSPSNPSGAVYSHAELSALAEILRQYPNIHVLSDDMYEHIRFQETDFMTLAAVAPDLKERVLTMNGVSKAYVMTGFRLGYAGGNQALIKAINMLNSQTTTAPSTTSQWAAITALEKYHDFLKSNCDIFQGRRDLIVKVLNEIEGISCPTPDGAFYVYPNCRGLIGKKTPKGDILKTDEDVVHYFLNYANVAVVHGEAFGMSPHFRISYATSNELLAQAAIRIKDACEQLIN